MRISDWSSDVCSSDLKMGDIEVKVGSEEFSFVGDREFGRIVVHVPNTVLLGAADIYVERPINGEYESEFFDPSLDRSEPVTADNKHGYAFAGSPQGVQVIVITPKDERLLDRKRQ